MTAEGKVGCPNGCRDPLPPFPYCEPEQKEPLAFSLILVLIVFALIMFAVVALIMIRW
jgi:hypothetical protein